jgi:3-hydroxyacyl-CoA dehydrogenase
MADPEEKETIALIGLGTIGLSFAALHLRYSNANLRLYDVRSDLKEHIESLLPVYLESTKKEGSQGHLSVQALKSDGRLLICSSIEEVCSGATIVQEQGPDSVDFKKSNWAQVVKHVSPSAHLWSSTSGILASKQVEDLEDKSRVLVVHPFNPVRASILLQLSVLLIKIQASYHATDRGCSFTSYHTGKNTVCD